MQAQGKEINHDITISIDTVASRLYSDRVPDRFEVAERIEAATLA